MKQIACGIDFGTSNSAMAVARPSGVELMQLEGNSTTIPSAVFFNLDEQHTAFGRQAIGEYLDHYSGRLMRSLKSLLGSDLMAESTLVGMRRIDFSQIIGLFISELKNRTESIVKEDISSVVIGRPVHFVDDDAVADKRAENELREIVAAQGFRDIAFEYEPIAAARDYESGLTREELVLVVDIGGGTSDFSVIRLSPEAAQKADRKADILANSGVHIGGTDFDKRLSMSQIMPELGYGTKLKRNLDVPKSEYLMLSTWHLINFLYSRKNMAAVKAIYADAERRDLLARFVDVVENQKGHEIASRVEAAKIALSTHPVAEVDMGFIESGWQISLSEGQLLAATCLDIDSILDVAKKTVLKDAGLPIDSIHTVFMTGGSTGMPGFSAQVQAVFPDSRLVQGDLLSSVAKGLGITAQRVFV